MTTWPSTITSSATVALKVLPVVAVLVSRSVTSETENDVPAGTDTVAGAAGVWCVLVPDDVGLGFFLAGVDVDGEDAGGGVYCSVGVGPGSGTSEERLPDSVESTVVIDSCSLDFEHPAIHAMLPASKRTHASWLPLRRIFPLPGAA